MHRLNISIFTGAPLLEDLLSHLRTQLIPSISQSDEVEAIELLQVCPQGVPSDSPHDEVVLSLLLLFESEERAEVFMPLLSSLLADLSARFGEQVLPYLSRMNQLPL